MQATYLARFGNQDIHKLLGVTVLSWEQRLIFETCLADLVTAEFTPHDGGNTKIEVGHDE